MQPSFVFDFTSVLIFGPGAGMFVATAGIGARALVARPLSRWPLLLNAATVLVATRAASLAHRDLGGTYGEFAWPLQALPIAAAVVAYCLVKTASAEAIAPLFSKQTVTRSWLKTFLRQCPQYFIGAGVATGLAELIGHGNWQLLPVVAVPLYFAHAAYRGELNRRAEDGLRREIAGSIEQGLSVIDHNGQVTLWDDALERVLDCPRERALNRLLVGAVPALNETELPRVIAEAMTKSEPRTLTHLGVRLASGVRILQVTILPVADGLTLLWHDVTDTTRTEQMLKRNEARLALAAAGANDGLWEWDLRTQECYFSGRWKTLIGLPPVGGIGRPQEWMDRVHPEDMGPLKEALELHLAGTTEHFHNEHRIRHEDGTYRRFLCRAVAARSAGGRPARIGGSLTDTTEQAIAEERLRDAGFLDPLTGLCNRAVFVEGLGQRLVAFKKQCGGARFAALYLDLDRFKIVNDSLGHLVGDELLTAVSRRLEACLRQGDALARLGGDEFAIMLNAVDDEQQANAVAFRIQKALSAPFAIGGREVFSSASIGIAMGLAHYDNPDEIMRDADTAMYHAKAHGKARHELFDADMHARARDRLGLESDLRHAIARNDFEVHYQPIVSLASRRCVGFESLVRWTRNGEAISPALFIPIAEELGLIETLGTWVLQEACRTFADWQRRYPDAGLDCITVNVSSRQLTQQHFRLTVEQAVQQAQLKPRDLRLEITETALMDSPGAAAELLRELRDFGVKIYLDDFGTGYSSLSHLHKLPVDALKIDRSFVRSLVISDRPAIVESILALARTLNTSVVAEGIESEDQALELERLGCTHAQGFLFARPLAAGAAEQVIAARQPLSPKHVGASSTAVPIQEPRRCDIASLVREIEGAAATREMEDQGPPRLIDELAALNRFGESAPTPQ